MRQAVGNIVIGLVLAALSAGAVLWIAGAFAATALDDSGSGARIVSALVNAGACILVIAVPVVAVTEARRIRGILFYPAIGLLSAIATYLLVDGPRSAATLATYMAAGLAAGTVYWRVTGKSAGRLAAQLAASSGPFDALRSGGSNTNDAAVESDRNDGLARAGAGRQQMSDLKLLALDTEDLQVISAHLQDAILRVGDMAFLAPRKRFALLANRFDWAHAGAQPRAGGTSARPQRRRAALRFDRVLAAKVQGLDLADKRATLSLLAITFAPAPDPAEPEGVVTLTFSGGAAIRLNVECLEVELRDMGPVWTTKLAPEHPANVSTETES